MLLWESLVASRSAKLGTSASDAAVSAAAIKAVNPNAQDGVYWIDLPTVGPTQIYCLMNSTYDGGGWMMAMKATRGTTFNYSSNYWTTTNTLNPTQTNTNDGDAKFHTMNYFAAKDIMAIFPDMSNGGSIAGSTRGWTWLEKNFVEYLQSQRIFYDGFAASSSASSWEISTDGGSSYSTASAHSTPWGGWVFSSGGWLQGPVPFVGTIKYRQTFNLSSAPSKPPCIFLSADDYLYSSWVSVNGVSQSHFYRGWDDAYNWTRLLMQPLANLTSGSNTIIIDIYNNDASTGFSGLLAYERSFANRNYLLGIPLLDVFSDNHPIFFRSAKTFNGWASGSFSSQASVNWYGLNYAAGGNVAVRWGFGWNNEAVEGSNDVFGGIGMSTGNYSAGDLIQCCQDTTGINRSARVEMYVR